MNILKLVLLTLLLSCLSSYGISILSPNKNIVFNFEINQSGEPKYFVLYKNKIVIKPSKMGLTTLHDGSLGADFEIKDTIRNYIDESWNPVYGEQKTIRNNYNELAITLNQKQSNRFIIIKIRVFNDGLGFRYEFPKQDGLSYFIVKDEITEFRLNNDCKAFWQKGDYDTNEYLYTISKISEIPQKVKNVNTNSMFLKSPISNLSVQTPLQLKSEDGLYINIHEAGLINYPAMALNLDAQNLLLSAHLCPDAVGNKAYMQTPASTPWRTIIVSDKAGDILLSRLILNLNEPCTYKDVSWIKPIKYVGVWWEFFTGGSTWAYSDESNVKLSDDFSLLKPNNKHGANTKNVKKYIDFASKHNFDGVLVEGWNIGWESWIGKWKEEVFDYVTPYPDFNLEEIKEYAKIKGIKLIMSHETSGSACNYERRLDTAFRFMKHNNYSTLKTGYVGKIIPRGEYHDGQWMVNHYLRVAQKAAEYKICVNSHEAVRPTGLHRTFPNWFSQESGRGTEYEACGIMGPEHTSIMPFTRLIGGPMDYTPGILEHYQTDGTSKSQTTIARQLAYYVTMYSPFQMAADLPENYDKYPDAFQFIKDVAIDWDSTCVLEAEPGDYIIMARKAKNKNEWFIGSITDENERACTIKFDFLDKNKKYVATIYADAKGTSWLKNKNGYTISKINITSKSSIKQTIGAGGGLAISIK